MSESLLITRSRIDAREVLEDTLREFNCGARSVRELCRNSRHWTSQVGCALARLLWLGKIRKVNEGATNVVDECPTSPNTNTALVGESGAIPRGMKRSGHCKTFGARGAMLV